MKKLNLLILIAPLLLSGCMMGDPCGSRLPEGLKPLSGNPQLGQVEDQAQLFSYYRCRAGQDDEEAMYRLGLAYELGLGVEVDLDKAADWYEKAARSKTGLEYNYLYNRPVQKGPSSEGNAEAQYRLGMMYLEGRGRKQDNGFAHLWFGRSAEQGHAAAKKEFDKLEREFREMKEL